MGYLWISVNNFDLDMYNMSLCTQYVPRRAQVLLL